MSEKKGLTEDEIEQIKLLAKKGILQSDIGKKFKISSATVRYHLKKKKLDLSPTEWSNHITQIGRLGENLAKKILKEKGFQLIEGEGGLTVKFL